MVGLRKIKNGLALFTTRQNQKKEKKNLGTAQSIPQQAKLSQQDRSYSTGSTNHPKNGSVELSST